MRRWCALVLAACFFLSACSPLPATIPRYGSPPAEAQLIQSEFDILLNDYVLPLDPAVLGLASATGMRDAVAQQLGAAATEHFPFQAFGGSAATVRVQIAQQYQAVRGQYPQVNTVAVAHAALASMAASVGDCHTNFFTAAQYREQQAELDGKVQFGGIGASLKDRPGSTPLIGQVFSGLPAASAGLHRGDAILRVDGHDVQGLTAYQVVNLIRGPVGTVVRLDVQRAGTVTLHFSITRQDVSPPALSAGILNGSTGLPLGYVHIFAFTPAMPQQLAQTLQEFGQRGARGWILDLRDDSGGTVQSLLDAASLFIPQGPIARFANRAGQVNQIDVSGHSGPAPAKLVVLVNHDSYSAAEILAAALREQDRVPVIGTPTAGCVAVGEVHTLADGSAVEYAVDKVFSPVQNRLLNGAGVLPTVAVPMSLADLAAGNDPQLVAAVAIVEGTTPASSVAPAPPAPSTVPKLIPGATPSSRG